jgi:uncharacterized protein YjbI with pentapeptide repeats
VRCLYERMLKNRKDFWLRRLLSYRVLVVEDTDLAQGEARVVLRKRDFRFALLNRSDLRRADLVWADLRSAQMSKTRVDKGKLKDTKLQGADLKVAQLQGADLNSAKLHGADFLPAVASCSTAEQANLNYVLSLLAPLANCVGLFRRKIHDAAKPPTSQPIT